MAKFFNNPINIQTHRTKHIYHTVIPLVNHLASMPIGHPLNPLYPYLQLLDFLRHAVEFGLKNIEQSLKIPLDDFITLGIALIYLVDDPLFFEKMFLAL